MDDTEIFFDRYAIILGVIPEDVPQIFTMTTKPDLIFGVIRDPPGGASSTTLAQGSVLTTSMAIEGAHAADLSVANNVNFHNGYDLEKGSVKAPFGLGAMGNVFNLKVNSGQGYSGTQPSPVPKSSLHFDSFFIFGPSVSCVHEVVIIPRRDKIKFFIFLHFFSSIF